MKVSFPRKQTMGWGFAFRSLLRKSFGINTRRRMKKTGLERVAGQPQQRPYWFLRGTLEPSGQELSCSEDALPGFSPCIARLWKGKGCNTEQLSSPTDSHSSPKGRKAVMGKHTLSWELSAFHIPVLPENECFGSERVACRCVVSLVGTLAVLSAAQLLFQASSLWKVWRAVPVDPVVVNHCCALLLWNRPPGSLRSDLGSRLVKLCISSRILGWLWH